MSVSLIGRLRSSAFRLSAGTLSMSLAGSRFSSESAPQPFHHGIRGSGGTIFTAALPYLIHRPARDPIPRLASRGRTGGSQASALPDSHSLPSSARSNHRPPAFGSITISLIGDLLMLSLPRPPP